MRKKSPSVNLLSGGKKHFLDQLIDWALSAGRLIIIITEIIALSAFLYRFSLDKALVDVRDEIRSRQQIVKSLKNLEDKYRNFQQRLRIAKRTLPLGERSTKVFTDVVALPQTDLKFNTLTATADTIKIDAQVQSTETLASFITKLREYPAVASVSIDRIENKTSIATIQVSVTAVLKKQ